MRQGKKLSFYYGASSGSYIASAFVVANATVMYCTVLKPCLITVPSIIGCRWIKRIASEATALFAVPK